MFVLVEHMPTYNANPSCYRLHYVFLTNIYTSISNELTTQTPLLETTKFYATSKSPTINIRGLSLEYG